MSKCEHFPICSTNLNRIFEFPWLNWPNQEHQWSKQRKTWTKSTIFLQKSEELSILSENKLKFLQNFVIFCPQKSFKCNKMVKRSHKNYQKWTKLSTNWSQNVKTNVDVLVLICVDVAPHELLLFSFSETHDAFAQGTIRIPFCSTFATMGVCYFYKFIWNTCKNMCPTTELRLPLSGFSRFWADGTDTNGSENVRTNTELLIEQFFHMNLFSFTLWIFST